MDKGECSSRLGPNARRKVRHQDVLRRVRGIIKEDKGHGTTVGLFGIPYTHTQNMSGAFTRKMALRDFVWNEKKDVTTGLWKGMDVEDEELRKFLDQVLSENPYVAFSSERMKAVIGNLYINRDVQGDFVYLNLREQSSLFGGLVLENAATEGGGEAENYFSLESNNGDFWISIDGVEGIQPNSTTLVSVNGDNALVSSSYSLGERGKRKLEFGDIITISTNNGEEEWERTDFLFMMPSEGQLIKQISTDRSRLYNPLILANILSFLPTNNVKEARRVSLLWNEEAIQELRKRTHEVVIRVVDQDKIGSGDMTMFHPLSEPILKFRNWKVALPASRRMKMGETYFYARTNKIRELIAGFLECLKAQRTRMTDRKTLDDVNGLFFGNQKRNVKSLHLTIGTEREAQLRMLEIILGGVKDTLKAFTLMLTLDFVKQDYPPLFPSSLEELPWLTHLTIGLTVSTGQISLNASQATTDIKRFLSSLLPAVGNIQSLTILKLSSTHTIVEEIAKMQNQEEPYTKFGKLSQIQLQDCSCDTLNALSTLHKNSLRSLELWEIDLEVAADRLRQTLEGFSESLEELKTEFRASYRTPTHIKFPARMRNLKSLSVFLMHDWLSSASSLTQVHFPRLDGLDEEEDHQRMNDDIDYIRHFPSLNKLTVAPVKQRECGSQEMSFQISEETSWRTFLPFLSAFLPTLGRAPNITTLDIPFLLRGKYHPVLDNLEVIFPSVDVTPEGELAQARGGPIWTEEED